MNECGWLLPNLSGKKRTELKKIIHCFGEQAVITIITITIIISSMNIFFKMKNQPAKPLEANFVLPIASYLMVDLQNKVYVEIIIRIYGSTYKYNEEKRCRIYTFVNNRKFFFYFYTRNRWRIRTPIFAYYSSFYHHFSIFVRERPIIPAYHNNINVPLDTSVLLDTIHMLICSEQHCTLDGWISGFFFRLIFGLFTEHCQSFTPSSTVKLLMADDTRVVVCLCISPV